MEITEDHKSFTITANNRPNGSALAIAKVTAFGLIASICMNDSDPYKINSFSHTAIVDIPKSEEETKQLSREHIPDLSALIESVKDSLALNMTQLSEIFGVSRPTIYSWKKGETHKVSPNKIKKLNHLAAVANEWQKHTQGQKKSFILDYKGSEAKGPTIRELLLTDFNSAEIIEIIPVRFQQFKDATTQSREILGEASLHNSNADQLPEASQRMHAAWSSNKTQRGMKG